MQPNWFRLAYAIEFLLALVAISVTWSQVGGQTHLDLMAWPWKLALTFGLAWITIRYTAAIVESENSWNARSAAWLIGGLLVVAAMAGITYYYHLQEALLDPDSDEPAVTTMTGRLK